MKEDVFNSIINLFRESKIAHAYLIETNNLDKCLIDLKNAISEIIDDENISNLIKSDALPSLTVVYPIEKEIKISQIEELKHKCNLIPLYTKNNFYIVVNAEKMNKKSFNSMLKFIEEPSKDTIGFFLCNNKDDVANTIVSRCELLRKFYNDFENINNSVIDNVINCFNNKSQDILWYNISNIFNLKYEREEYINFVKDLHRRYYNDYIKNKLKVDFDRTKIVEKYLNMLCYNVNCELLINSLLLEIGDTYE